jgi:hypothetical protein
MNKFLLVCFTLTLVAGLASTLPNRAFADAIMVTRAMTADTIAEIFIEGDSVRVDLEIGARDLEGFAELLPDDLYEQLGHAPEPLVDRLQRFPTTGFTLRADDGPQLRGRITGIENRARVVRDEIAGEPLPLPAGDAEQVIFVSMTYPLASRPSTLVLGLGTAPRPRPITIGFVTYHRGLPVNDFRYLSREETLVLDWDDPWFSRFENRNLRRQYSAPMNVFLYAEPFEVRCEVIIRPTDLQYWVDLGLADLEAIPIDLQGSVKQTAAEFLQKNITVTVDGEARTPTLDRIHFLRRTLKTSMVIDPPEELDIVSAVMGIIFVFPTETLAQNATLEWTLFNERIREIPAAATDEAGPLPSILRPGDQVLEWKNFLKNPTLPTLVEIERPSGSLSGLLGFIGWFGLILFFLLLARQVRRARQGLRPTRAWIAVTGGVALSTVLAFSESLDQGLDQERSETVISGLLHNVYRAFDYRSESDIYDVLDRSVSGNLLASTYLETRRGLELANQGGARAKVKEIALITVDARPAGGGTGFRARCTWNVMGSVGHWGHVHQRTNQYDAELTVRPVNGVWKITELKLLEEKRL